MLVFDPEILDRSYQFFVKESPELLQILEQGLLNLRQLPLPQRGSDPAMQRLTQAIRMLEKGAARMGLHDIQAIAHRLDSALQTVEEEGFEIGKDLEAILLKAFDCLRSPLMQEIQTGQHDDRLSLQTADEVFAQLETYLINLQIPKLEIKDEATEWHETLADLENLLEAEIAAGFPGSTPGIPPVYHPYLGNKEGQSPDYEPVPVTTIQLELEDKKNSKPPALREESSELVERIGDRLQSARIHTAHNISNTIRVDLSRLEKLNNLISELFIQETGSVLQIQQLQDRLNSLSQRFRNFEQFTKELHSWAHRSQTSKAKLQSSRSSSSIYSFQGYNTSPNTDFDPLQMDSYNHLYSLAQAMTEEIAQLGEAMQDTNLLCQQARTTQRRRQHTVKQIRGGLLRARMFPVNEILQRFPRMVRDLSAQYQKQVVVKLSGTHTLMDKSVLEKLLDPMVHLVRNGFDHGIEMPDVRVEQRKPAQATIEIRAYHRGNQTYIEVRDDGRGIDIETVRSKIVAQNMISAVEAQQLTRDRLYEYLFAPGFSTAAKVSELSGRGVGLDVVQEQIKNLKGSITVVSEPGKGTTFTLRLPLTLTIAKLLVFSVNSHLMAIPVDSLVSIVTASTEQIETHDGKQFYSAKGDAKRSGKIDRIPLCPQTDFLAVHASSRVTVEQLQAIPLPLEDKVPLLLIAHSSKIVAIQVDQILHEQELVIKPFGNAIKTPAHLYGCTILGDGSLVPVLDGQGLMSGLKPIAAIPAQCSISTPHVPTILVVDDSLTVRQSMVFTLEKAGYRVLQARDGKEGIAQLQQELDIQAVFCDVEMPRMNGFEFLNQCRQEFAEAAPPVIMLTSRGGDKHRQTAKELGASSYLTKPYLEQDLLKTLQTVLEQYHALQPTL
jgi:two-component system, chemotaxis family, sensor histidine kinase and response regulator PixL